MFPAYAGSASEGEIEDDKFQSFTEAAVQIIREQREESAEKKRALKRFEDWHTLRPILYSEPEEISTEEVMVPSSQLTGPPSPSKKKRKTKRKKKKHRRKHRKSSATLHKKRKSRRYSSESEESGSSSSTPHRKFKSRRSSSESGEVDSSSSSSESDRERKRKRRWATPKFRLKEDKWNFLAPGEENSANSYIVIDKTYSHENFGMDSIPQREAPVCKLRFHGVLNGNKRLNELFFPKETRQSRQKVDWSGRYFGGQLRNLDEANIERSSRKLPSLSETNADYISLSKHRLEKFQFMHEILERETAEGLLEEVGHRTPGPSHTALEERRRLIASEFSKDTGNAELLNQFLKVNEEIFERSRTQGAIIDRRPLMERQISILDQAIAGNPRMVEYRLKRLQFLKEFRLPNELLSEWERILNAFVNNCSVWEKYLDFIQYDMAIYQSEDMEKAFDRCHSKLTAILSGTFRSHKPEKRTAEFLMKTSTRHAISRINSPRRLWPCLDRHLIKSPMEIRHRSHVSFGEKASTEAVQEEDGNYYYSNFGGINENRDFEFVDREAQVQQISQLEERVSSSSDDAVVGWVELERELDNIESRPRRQLTQKYASLCVNSEEQWSAQNEVAFEEIRILQCCDDNAVSILLGLLGAKFNTATSSMIFYQNYQLLSRAPTFDILDEWGLLPPSKTVFTIPSAGARNIALNMVYAYVKLRPSIELVTSLLETKASHLDRLFFDKPTGIRITTMRDYLREIMTSFESVNTGLPTEEFEMTIVAYALNLFARWVCEDNVDVEQEVEQRTSNKQKAKPKKIKKGDRPFTSSQYITKLKEFIYKMGGHPISRMGPMQRQVVLRTLLSLVQALPFEFALDIITRIMLGKGDQDKLFPTDTLAALDEWKGLFRVIPDYSKPLSCFESPLALCIALRIHFNYARASDRPEQWVGECEDYFQFIDQCETPDDRSVILSAYLDVLEHNWKHRHTLKSKLLEILARGQKTCPHDSSIIRRYINILPSVQLEVRMRRILFDGNTTSDDPTLDMYISLASIYLAKLKAKKIQDADVPVPADFIARAVRSEASRKSDPALWRLALAYADSKRFIDETHVLASAQCGWSRHLHIDYIAKCGSREKCVEVIKLMEERGCSCIQPPRICRCFETSCESAELMVGTGQHFEFWRRTEVQLLICHQQEYGENQRVNSIKCVHESLIDLCHTSCKNDL
ncbi:hypothetical protein KIN20_022321 [Parelaphostrongylus tenuis]|uniref:Uncharacterized protein n=1 Tax=Parelaphostrongylus tenuis TaxID=148309 RepID=A0AAD5N8V1_PARTN|nr:hypothetical protein KIN20_022321 [Parelaphostrongylus tenuis]